LSDHQVAALKPDPARTYFHPDPLMPGHGVRVYPSGKKSFTLVRRDAYGKQRWVSLGATTDLKIEQAREEARKVIARLKAGEDPFPAPKVKPDSVAAVAADWLKRHVEAKKLRTADELRRLVHKHILVPAWRNRTFKDIKRSDVAKLLDAVEDDHGAWIADSVLGTLRSMASWYATRHDDYTPPFVRGMKRVAATARKRDRILTDAELRKLWRTAQKLSDAENAARAKRQPLPFNGVSFARFVMVLLLCAQRRDKVASMKWSDLTGDGIWTIASEDREKSNAKMLKLPPLAIDIVNQQPRFASNPYVFPSARGEKHINGYTAFKARFDKRLGFSDYTLHDLRRTARSLMSRAGVSDSHAERTLGHAIPGVRGHYDLHSYADEKAQALVKLANLIQNIVNGAPDGNVLAFRGSAS
jgi:integrase